MSQKGSPVVGKEGLLESVQLVAHEVRQRDELHQAQRGIGRRSDRATACGPHRADWPPMIVPMRMALAADGGLL